MVASLKPIETKYKGYRCRSRLEARWAVFFDALGVRWEYEKEGYDLGDAGYYLPDFWLPQQSCWVEIKGEEPTDEEELKAQRLADHSTNSVFLFAGQIEKPSVSYLSNGQAVISEGSSATYYEPSHVPHYWSKKMALGWVWVGCKSCQGFAIIGVMEGNKCSRRFCECKHVGRYGLNGARLVKAYEAARSARFEHGESGARW